MSGTGRRLPGALVISLDFELRWGVRDRIPPGGAYEARLLGARAIIPRLLETFEAYDVAATWATVGFLFAATREEMARYVPRHPPAYAEPALSPYAEPTGANESEDPLHFGAELVKRIRRTRRQEIATHTFSHYFCREPGQTRRTFAADLAAACAIADRHGIRLRSIVFPRNQHEPAYDDILREAGILAYRGNPGSWLWRSAGPSRRAGRIRRAGRWLESYVPVAHDSTVAWSQVLQPSGLADVRASRMVRPYLPSLRHLEPHRLRRFRQQLVHAARAGRILHLWWHPHNFGLHQEENLAMLRGILDAFAECRDRYGMVSLSMDGVRLLADHRIRRGNRGVPAAPGSSGFVRAPPVALPVEPAPPGRSRTPPVLLHVTTVPMSLTFLVGQLGYMTRRGFAVQVVSSPGPELDRFARREGVSAVPVEMSRRITPVRDLRSLAALAGALRRTKPTIVHAHTPKGGLLGMIAAAMARVPVRVYHLRGLPMLAAGRARGTLLRAADRLACGLAHQVICVSGSLRDEAIRHRVCPPGKIKVLGSGSGNGVDCDERFRPARTGSRSAAAARRRLGFPVDATVIGFVGRIVRDKGIVELCRAWQRLREDHPAARLLLVGPFEAEDPVPRETEALLRSDPRVLLTGMDWDTPPLYAAMDLVVLPSHREGFPNVPLEAAAMELPVVATRIPGCVDAVSDGVTGTLVPAGDAVALADAIRKYLADPRLRRAHGRAGRERVLREFRPESIWAALHAEYIRLLEPGRRPRGEAAPDAAPAAAGEGYRGTTA